MRKIDSIVVHCSATKNLQVVDVEAIRKYHIEHNGWRDIGYHGIINPPYGEFTIGRTLDQVGAHVSGFNKTSIGVCLIGTDVFTRQQFITLRYYIDGWRQLYDIPLWNIFTHNHFKTAVLQGKTCPGFTVGQLLTWYITSDWDAVAKNVYAPKTMLE